MSADLSGTIAGVDEMHGKMSRERVAGPGGSILTRLSLPLIFPSLRAGRQREDNPIPCRTASRAIAFKPRYRLISTDRQLTV